MPIDLFGTKKLVGIFEDALGVTLPKTDAVLTVLAERLDQSGVLISEATDLVRELDAAVESVPKEWRKLVKAMLGGIDHAVRVGTRASNAAQSAQATADTVTELVRDIREHGFETHSRIAKPEGADGGS